MPAINCILSTVIVLGDDDEYEPETETQSIPSTSTPTQIAAATATATETQSIPSTSASTQIAAAATTATTTATETQPNTSISMQIASATATTVPSDLYKFLKDLQFPPGHANAISSALKVELLAPTLRRQVQTRVLVEPAASKRRAVKFNTSLPSKYKWLMVGDDGAYCIYCKLFCTNASRPRIAGEFTAKPYTTYSRAKLCDEHANAVYHKAAAESASAFLSVADGAQPSIIAQVRGETRDFHTRKLRLHTIAKCILVCAKECLPLRGKRNESDPPKPLAVLKNNEEVVLGDSSQGNVMALLRLRRDAGDLNTDVILNDRAKYTSPTIQNELLSIMSSQVLDGIICAVSKSHFSIIADETTDVSTTEQLCIAVRYMDMDSHKLEERFLKFVCATDVTGLALSAQILKECEELGLDFTKCRGQAYDGGSNMAGSIRGTAALIQNKYPKAIYQHCKSHCLNLVLAKVANSIPEIDHVWTIQADLCAFFSRSAKRTHALAALVNEETTLGARKTKLHSLSQTRWIERYDALRTTVALLPAIADTLAMMTRDPRFNDSRGTASALNEKIGTFRFIMGLTVAEIVITLTNDLCLKLQGRTIDVAQSDEEVRKVKRAIRRYRNEVDFHHDAWYEKAVVLATQLDIQPAVPRMCARQTNRNNVPATSVSSYFKRAITIPILDTMDQELHTRFPDNTRHSVLLLMPSCVIDESIDVIGWKELILEALSFYNDDLPTPAALDMELTIWYNYWNTHIDEVVKCDTAVSAAAKAHDLILENLCAAFKVIAILPITSNEAERSFSRMKLIKSDLRSTMTNERLNSLAILAIHRDKPVSITEAINVFVGRRSRIGGH